MSLESFLYRGEVGPGSVYKLRPWSVATATGFLSSFLGELSRDVEMLTPKDFEALNPKQQQAVPLHLLGPSSPLVLGETLLQFGKHLRTQALKYKG